MIKGAVIQQKIPVIDNLPDIPTGIQLVEIGASLQIDWDYTRMIAGESQSNTLIQLGIVNESLDLTSTPLGSDFVVKVNDVAQPSGAISMSIDYVRINLTQPFSMGDEIKVSYTSGANPLRGGTTGNLVPNITDVVCLNILEETTLAPPTWVSYGEMRGQTSNASNHYYPLGTLAGDLMVAIAWDNNVGQPSTDPTPPDGFVEVCKQYNNNLNYYISMKVADGTEAGGTFVNTVWPEDASNRSYGIMYTFRGADINSVEAITQLPTLFDRGQVYTNTNNNLTKNSLAVALYLQEDDIATTDNSVGYVTRHYHASSAGSDTTVAIATQELINIGDPDGSAFYDSPSIDWNTNFGWFFKAAALATPIVGFHKVSNNGIYSGTASNSRAFRPTDIALGDLFIAVFSINHDDPSTPGALPTGWTLVSQESFARFSYVVAWKVCDSEDLGLANQSVAVNWTTNGTNRCFGMMYAFRGVSGINGVEANGVAVDTGRAFNNSNQTIDDNTLACSIYLQGADLASTTDNSSGYEQENSTTNGLGRGSIMILSSQIIPTSGSDDQGSQQINTGIDSENVNIGFYLKFD